MRVEYIWVWILTLLAIAGIVWIIYSPMNLFSELDARIVAIAQIEGDVVNQDGHRPEIGSIVELGDILQGGSAGSHVILSLSDRSFIHLSGEFYVVYDRIEGYRLPGFRLVAGWLHNRINMNDLRIPTVVQTPSGILFPSTQATSWLAHPYTESFIEVSANQVRVLIPNGPFVWNEEEGRTTLRSGSYFTAQRYGTQRQMIELPPPPEIVFPEDNQPVFLPGDLARGYTLNWRSEQPVQSYVLRVERDGTMLPVLQTTSTEPAYTLSNLRPGTYVARVGAMHTDFGVSRWSDGFIFSVSGRANPQIDCTTSPGHIGITMAGNNRYVYGCLPQDQLSQHVGIYALADIWYLQSPGSGAVPDSDGYWEMAVVDAPRYLAVIQHRSEDFPIQATAIRPRIGMTVVEISP